ncbi:helix-turn-helix domain-containing protein [Sulfurimonas crateris]|uniref:Helix-turn-helix domain-containing protein n=1 Tax=Sulfurimonas crateris TaxID=2574727 RepID=A0A4U2Z6F8_9BACT|nr:MULTISPECIES: helix-turn-helix domain-containing protein [Sulfurimonas]MBW6489100.1 helix-turn-helix domain-containing protein [Sulfurimonas sp.]TKI69072.1 helix-turn-helix domain-containing protein [Sulfurimonas crateris]
MKENQKRWLTPVEFEEEFAICVETQKKMRSEKRIPYSKIGRKFVRYDRLKIDQWFEEHEVVGYEQ